MKRIVVLIVIALSSCFQIAHADNNFEKNYFNIGYKEVDKAWRESEEYFKRSISLPTQLPPIPFTHQFGRLTKDLGKKNDLFEMIYLHEDYGDHHYFIRIVPAENSLPLRPEQIDREYLLVAGQKAIYSTNIAQGFNILIFEKDGWQYLMAIDKRVSDKVQPERLVEIANSIQ